MVKNIVLIHGWGASVDKLLPLEKSLISAGFVVRTLKLPGFDLPAPKKPWTVDDYADYVVSKISFDKYYIFGHSFGGRVAIKATLEDKRIVGLVLCSISGITRGSTLKRLFFGSLSTLGRSLEKLNFLHINWRRFLYKLAREHDYEKLSGVMRETFKNIVEEDLKKYAHQIQIPTLILWGRNDKMTPVSDAHYLKNNISNSKMIIFDNMGHKLPYEKYREITKEINSWV